jgi:hypothetical protein
MDAEAKGEWGKVEPGPKQLHLALEPTASFEEIVKTIEVSLTLPELPGFRGCAPCFSGLDRLVVNSTLLGRIR